MLTAERLRELLEYDPTTGVFRWKVSSGRAAVGSVAAPKSQHIKVDGGFYKASRLAWLYMTGEWPVHVVDHINRKPKDNRWLNLRDITQAKNCQNMGQKASNTSGHTGVGWDKRRGKWLAHITVDYKFKFLGYFLEKESAIEARKAAEKEHFIGGGPSD